MEMTRTENRMVPMSLTVDIERQDKLSKVSQAVRRDKSRLIRVMIDRLINELGDPKNPNPRALARLLKECDAKSVVSSGLPRGRKPLRPK
jgi:predicted DNA-binding protein